jgi:protein-S-isoprenylcysteine O-methyltransferase Ste14
MISRAIADQGAWIFRWRSYLLLGFVPFFMIAVNQPRPVDAYLGPMANSLFEAFCIVVTLSGLAIRVVTVGFVPAGTSGRNTRRQLAHELNTTGLYSLTRNPLYLGNAVTIMGITLSTQNGLLILAMGLFLVIYLERIIAAEEAFLINRFGETYMSWAAKIPAFFPRRSGWHGPALKFCWRSAIRREYGTLLLVLFCLFAVDLLRELMISPAPKANTAWLIVIAGMSAVYLTLLWVTKRTRLLSVEGR